LKKIFLIFTIFVCLLNAGNFKEGMIAYKNGDFKKAKILFELAIKNDGATQPYFMLGKMYLYGEGVRINRKEAIKYLQKSAKKGNIRAKCYLAEAYLKDNNNKDKAMKLLKYGLKRKIRECKKIARIYNITLN